ncbi:MAG: AlpA family phage regulatory protein [Synechococcus sp. MED-G71]|nr:MAG: AlpA family phage regulatory protein [Synechococcus sp. MED-G71]
MLRIAEVIDRIGVSRATIYRWTAVGEFLKQIELGANSVV